MREGLTGESRRFTEDTYDTQGHGGERFGPWGTSREYHWGSEVRSAEQGSSSGIEERGYPTTVLGGLLAVDYDGGTLGSDIEESGVGAPHPTVTPFLERTRGWTSGYDERSAFTR